MSKQIESLAAKFHEIYQAEAKRQGDVRHKDAYADLPENIKEFDRVLARYVLSMGPTESPLAGLVAKWPHEQHTVWKDGIDIEECWPHCRRCQVETALAAAGGTGR